MGSPACSSRGCCAHDTVTQLVAFLGLDRAGATGRQGGIAFRSSSPSEAFIPGPGRRMERKACSFLVEKGFIASGFWRLGRREWRKSWCRWVSKMEEEGGRARTEGTSRCARVWPPGEGGEMGRWVEWQNYFFLFPCFCKVPWGLPNIQNGGRWRENKDKSPPVLPLTRRPSLLHFAVSPSSLFSPHHLLVFHCKLFCVYNFIFCFSHLTNISEACLCVFTNLL